MNTEKNWTGKTVFMTGGSRGIGREIALKFAQAGANVVIAAKSEVENERLPGTIHSVAKEVEALGGRALPVQTDAREEAHVLSAIEKAVAAFGGIDLLVNNAGYLGITPLEFTDTRKFDLMHALNTRAPFLTMKAALPHLKDRKGMVLNLCPPLNLDEGWLGAFIPYTSTKYGMTLLSMGFAQEVRDKGIAVRTLWPATLIATAAVGNFGGAQAMSHARKPSIMADAAFMLANDRTAFGDKISWLDEEVLRQSGVTDFAGYAHSAEHAGSIQRDFYVGPFNV